tara:strand:+ start:1633 stop:2484 length:852 start_codon:yes stop_codon:yes gene_type:complete
MSEVNELNKLIEITQKSKKIISDEQYSDYLEEVQNYYDLKNKFTKQKNILKNKIISSNSTSENKKLQFAKLKIKCVNCNKEGGTLFKETDKLLQATCGNVKEPCDLNIQIVKMTQTMLDKELININTKIKTIKNKIVITKLNFLFNYIEEAKAVELFDNYKKLLNNYQEIYNNIFNEYNLVVNNVDKKNLLNDKTLERIDTINNYKEYINLYNETDNKKYLNDAIELYNNIKTLDKDIRELKYNINNITIKNNDDSSIIYDTLYILIQKEFDLKDLEIINLVE